MRGIDFRPSSVIAAIASGKSLRPSGPICAGADDRAAYKTFRYASLKLGVYSGGRLYRDFVGNLANFAGRPL